MGKIEYLIGNSIGEFSALNISGFLDFDSTFSLIQKRGVLMEAFFEQNQSLFKSGDDTRDYQPR